MRKTDISHWTVYILYYRILNSSRLEKSDLYTDYCVGIAERRCEMRQFYEHVRVDKETLRFSVSCPICGKREYGMQLPFLCRGIRILARCEKGKANKLSQRIYNQTKANAVQQLAMHFNQCRSCYRFVCDDCYDVADSEGACKECVKKKHEK